MVNLIHRVHVIHKQHLNGRLQVVMSLFYGGTFVWNELTDIGNRYGHFPTGKCISRIIKNAPFPLSNLE